jgi:hypothetical protein
VTSPLTWSKQVWRRWYWRRHYRELRNRYGDTRRLLFFGGDGIGDELLCSTPLHELRRRGAKNLGVMTSRPELFRHSPDVDSVFEIRHADVALLRQMGVEASHLSYIARQLPPDIDVPPPRHLLAEMCRLAGLTGEVRLRPYLYLNRAELQAVAAYSGCVVVQSARRGASLKFGNKEWMPERFQAVVRSLNEHWPVVQLGTASDPRLEGAIDLRGQTDLRQSAAILAQATAFIGLVGLTMHLARAVDCRSVIIYGGREHPEQSGYPCNENLYRAVPCAPCWRWNSCEHDRRCLTDIEPGHVLEAFARLVERRAVPLEVAAYQLD